MPDEIDMRRNGHLHQDYRASIASITGLSLSETEDLMAWYIQEGPLWGALDRIKSLRARLLSGEPLESIKKYPSAISPSQVKLKVGPIPCLDQALWSPEGWEWVLEIARVGALSTEDSSSLLAWYMDQWAKLGRSGPDSFGDLRERLSSGESEESIKEYPLRASPYQVLKHLEQVAARWQSTMDTFSEALDLAAQGISQARVELGDKLWPILKAALISLKRGLLYYYWRAKLPGLLGRLAGWALTRAPDWLILKLPMPPVPELEGDPLSATGQANVSEMS